MSAGLIKAAFDIINPIGAVILLNSVFFHFKLHNAERFSSL